MKLYYTLGTCSLASHIILHECGFKFEIVPVKGGQYAGGDFKRINPNGYVPALELDNGEVLTEGVSILQYLADQKPELDLIPKFGDFRRYRCIEWLNFVATEIHKTFSPLFHDSTPQDYKKICLEKLSKRFSYVESRLNGTPFLMGEEFTIADAYLFTVVRWSRAVKLDLAPWPHLSDYLLRIKDRPATVLALKAEGKLKT